MYGEKLAGLEIEAVSFSYFNGLVLNNVNLTIRAGEMVGLLGPNGSGKTTLIKMASGVLRPTSLGKVQLDGQSLSTLRRKAIARYLAVVPQQFNIPFAFTVEEVVTLGRIPFLKPLGEENENDRRIVDAAMKLVDVSHLKNRRFNELSGGEKQKVVLAMAMAQQPRILLLDEPTAHLDISHQVQTLELVKHLNMTQGLTVLAALHDLNLAASYFDRLVLLKKGEIVIDGTPIQVLTEKLIKEVFDTPVLVNAHPVTGRPHVIITPTPTYKS